MPCTLHEVIEGQRHPYRCSHCGKCFVCAHTQDGYEHWVCADGTRVPSTPSPGVLLTDPRA